jgi:hypothetical protein
MSPLGTSAADVAAEALHKVRSEIEKLLAELWDALAGLVPQRRQLTPPKPEPGGPETNLRAGLRALQHTHVRGVSLGAGELFVSFEREGGIWTLGTGGSHWGLMRNGELVVDDSGAEEQLARFSEVQGLDVIHAAPRIHGVEPGVAALNIALGHGWGFAIIASAEAIRAKLPLFELRDPDNTYLLVFGDGVVSEARGDVPIPKLVENGTLHRWPSAV